MSQLDLHKVTGVSQRTIGRIEAGQGENSRNITILEDFLGIGAGEELEPAAYEPEPEPPTIGRVMQHLAEAMRLLAQLEYQDGSRPTPPVAARVTFPRSAAPSARRRPENGDQPVRGVD